MGGGGGRSFSNFLKCGVVDGSVETTECLTHPFVWGIFVTKQLHQRYEIRIWWKASYHFYLAYKEKKIKT